MAAKQRSMGRKGRTVSRTRVKKTPLKVATKKKSGKKSAATRKHTASWKPSKVVAREPGDRKSRPLRKKSATVRNAAMAAAAECVPAETAQAVVDACMEQSHVGGVPKTTKIGDVLPGAAANNFCRCVADRSGVSDFACGPDNTFQDVEISITCP